MTPSVLVAPFASSSLLWPNAAAGARKANAAAQIMVFIASSSLIAPGIRAKRRPVHVRVLLSWWQDNAALNIREECRRALGARTRHPLVRCRLSAVFAGAQALDQRGDVARVSVQDRVRRDGNRSHLRV